MENVLKMPTNYCVMTEEEMTYTEGGADASMAEALLCWFVGPYGWIKGLTAVRNYRKANPNTWLDTGMDALSKDMEKSVPNAVRDVACGLWMLSTSATGVGLIINAIVIFS